MATVEALLALVTQFTLTTDRALFTLYHHRKQLSEQACAILVNPTVLKLTVMKS